MRDKVTRRQCPQTTIVDRTEALRSAYQPANAAPNRLTDKQMDFFFTESAVVHSGSAKTMKTSDDRDMANMVGTV